jgi:serine/threonine protein kinase
MERLGKFQLRKILGKGASGTVFLALDTFTGKDVALKVLDPEVVNSPDFDRTNTVQFMNEASLAGKLQHPHIAAILEASVTEKSGYIAIEYVPGGDLSQYTTPGKQLPQEQAIQIAFKCCGALDYAFRQGIVHRDIKPANILVVSGTNIKVADFGAAYLSKGPRAADRRDRLAPLHVARAGQGRGARPPQRHVLARRGALPAVHRAVAAHGGRHSTNCWRRSATKHPLAPSARRPELSHGHRPHPAADDGQDAGAALSVLGGAGAGHRPDRPPQRAPEFDRRQRKVRCAEEGQAARPARRCRAMGAGPQRTLVARSRPAP